MKKLHAYSLPEGLKIRQRLACISCLLLFGMFFFTAPVVSAQQQLTGQDDRSAWDLRKYYATKLGVAPDSLTHLQLYQMLERWPEFVRSNPEKLAAEPQGIFAQFVYYLAFNTKISSSVANTFADEKTYLFKNTTYLRSGDLLFFGTQAAQPDQLAIYLQNSVLVYPATDGQLQFVSLQDLQKRYKLTAAKVLKDE